MNYYNDGGAQERHDEWANQGAPEMHEEPPMTKFDAFRGWLREYQPNNLAIIDARIAELERQVARSGCPCQLVEPCQPNCSCANQYLSGGCSRCARYGSDEQRLAAATRLAELEAEVARWEEREAACCPEDRGFEEVISTLRATNARLVGLLKEARPFIPNEQDIYRYTPTVAEVGRLLRERILAEVPDGR